MPRMKIEVDVEGTVIAELAYKQLEAEGLDPNQFDMKHNTALNGGERGEGNLSLVRYTFERKS